MSAAGIAGAHRPAPSLPMPAEAAALRLAAQLAGRLARPLGHLDPSATRLSPLAPERLAAAPAPFRTALDRAVSRELRLGALNLDRGLIERLATRARSRVAVLVVAQPMAAVMQAALTVAAAALHRPVLALVLRADREQVRALLGPAAFQVATQEAPVLHAALADLAGIAGPVPLPGGQDPVVARARVAELGLHILGRFLAAVEPPLTEVYRHRLPADLAPAADGPALAGPHADHVVRLLRRRMDAWSPIIA